MSRSMLLVLLLSAGCQPRADAPSSLLDPLGDRHPERARAVADPRPIGDRGLVRHHMRARLDDLIAVDHLLAHGRLAEARALAFMLSRPVHDPRLGQLAVESERAHAAALALAGARTVDDAYRLMPHVVEACSGCHARAGVQVDELEAVRATASARPAGRGARRASLP
ncbi:MAG TPA: hypothetical protein VM513_07930 [Kofleriaceae bacterium]|jgi:hypothetical protein|nr:hypothetical protein [Kofleriaceae bacterium]